MSLNSMGGKCPLRKIKTLSKGEKTMNWNNFMEVWNEFLAFMDRVVQWLMFIFGAGKWPPEDFPNIDDEATTTTNA